MVTVSILIAVYMSSFFLDTRKALFSSFLKNVTLFQRYVTVIAIACLQVHHRWGFKKSLEMHMVVKLGSHLYHHQAAVLCSAWSWYHIGVKSYETVSLMLRPWHTNPLVDNRMVSFQLMFSRVSSSEANWNRLI